VVKVADKQPVSAHPMPGDVAVPTPWQTAREHLEESTATYWPATVRPDGRPHVRPTPYDVYEVIPTTAFGFGTDESFSATRWRFE
jgi:hypothetical protein